MDREPAGADGSAERRTSTPGERSDPVEVVNRRLGLGHEYARRGGAMRATGKDDGETELLPDH